MHEGFTDEAEAQRAIDEHIANHKQVVARAANAAVKAEAKRVAQAERDYRAGVAA